MGIDVRVTGPLFDGRAARAISDAADDAREGIAEFAEEHVLALTGALFRHPTGYYESQVATTRVASDTSLVSDGGVVYGPWLEGVGSRNSPVTRFSGYGFWRAAKQVTQDRAPELAEQAIRRHLPEMGG